MAEAQIGTAVYRRDFRYQITELRPLRYHVVQGILLSTTLNITETRFEAITRGQALIRQPPLPHFVSFLSPRNGMTVSVDSNSHIHRFHLSKSHGVSTGKINRLHGQYCLLCQNSSRGKLYGNATLELCSIDSD